MKAFIFDPLWETLLTDDLKKKLDDSGLELVVTKELAPLSDCKALFEGTEERILCLNPDYVKWQLGSEDYKDIPNLKGILNAATAFSWVDTSFADAQNIPVCNIRNFSTQAVAEWAITMLVNLARQTPRLIKDGFPLDYDKDFMKYRGVELHGKKAGIVGLGNIGSAIAKRCAGLGMEVVYWSRTPKQNEYTFMELEQLMSECDVVIPAMALNDETKGILTDELIGTMKSSAIIVTIQHDLFNQELVLDMVKSGKLFGFGFEAKPGSFDNYEGNVWAGAEYGWVTDGSMHNCMVAWTDNMVNAAAGKFPNKVN